MPIEREEQLKKLQEEKLRLIAANESGAITYLRKVHDNRIIQIKQEMTELNKLDESEKNIHAIWIGIPPKGEFDHLKLWAKYNQDYKIHLWTDSTHILSHKLNDIISKNSKILNNNVKKQNYYLEASLKDEFYNNYQLELFNLEKTFDENAKQFLLDKKYATEDEIFNWIKEGKEKMLQEQKDIKKYTPNEVILHDVSQEKDNIFPNQKYYKGYLNDLEHLQICAGASDRLRYTILDKFGGVYLDTDLTMNFNLESLTKNKKLTGLINSLKWNKNDEKSHFFSKFDMTMNQMIVLDTLKQLNDEKLKDFNDEWAKVFNVDSKTNFKIFKKIAKEFKRTNLKLEPDKRLSEISIDNFLQIGSNQKKSSKFTSSFIFTKKNSKFLQEIMKKIEVVDERIKDMNTHEKLANKWGMITYHTGSVNLNRTILENDKTYFYLHGNNINIANFKTINNHNSSWCDTNKHKDDIKNRHELKALFFVSKEDMETLNYDVNFEVKNQLKKISLFQKNKQDDNHDKARKLNSSLKKGENSFEPEL